MERIWLKHYETQVPAEINPDVYPNLAALFLEACHRFHDRPALENFGTVLNYGQWEEYTGYFASFCQNRLGLQKGDRIAIMLPNVMQYLVVLFGALRAGLIIVNVNPLYTPDELCFQMNDSGAKAIVVLENFCHTVEKALSKTSLQHVITTQIGDLFPWPKRLIFNGVIRYIKKMIPTWNIPNAVSLPDCLVAGKQTKRQEPTLTGDDIAFLQYTGGTTGSPKAAVLTHRNMLANVEQTTAFIAGYFIPGQETIITALPLYHIFSLTANAFVFLKMGAKNVLITNPRDIPAFVKTLRNTRFQCITGVNTLFNALLHNADFKKIDFSSLKLTLGGGMAVQKEIADRWQKVTGKLILQAYGLTETSPAVSVNPIHTSDFNGSIGLPVPSTEVEIRDLNGEALPIGEVGELCVRGPQVMREYWHKPQETAKVLDENGWLRTGDIGKMDERGYLYLVDRLKDMIIVSGFKVYPNEVEDVIVQCPGVLEAGVVGVANEKGKEIVTAFVVKENPEITAEDILTHCRAHLTNYKVPKVVHFIQELPKSNVGKILRRQLRTG